MSLSGAAPIDGWPMTIHVEPSPLPRIAFAVAHALAFGAGLWVLTGGIQRLGELLGVDAVLGDEGRRAVLLGCGAVLLLRARLAIGPLLWRPFGWRAAFGCLGLAAACQVGFSLLGASEAAPLSAWQDRVGLAAFLLGSGLSTGAELARSRCVAASERRSALCTSGAFALVRHPNFLGDLLWGLGWASLTRSPWAPLLPVAVAVWHGTRSAGAVEQELEAQDGPRFRSWASRTKRIIPYIY